LFSGLNSPLNSPEGVDVDGSGNVFIADTNNNAIKEYVAATGLLVPLVPSGLNGPTGVKVGASGDVFIADLGNNAVKEIPHAFVRTTAITDPPGASNDQIGAAVLPASASLTGLFAPTSDQTWLTLGAPSGGDLLYSLAANTTGTPRTAHISVLG